MERNENGYPIPKTDRVTGNRNMGGDGRGCSADNDATLGDKPLAYAYVPIQRWRMLYPEEDALAHGTLFEELYKPREVYGNE